VEISGLYSLETVTVTPDAQEQGQSPSAAPAATVSGETGDIAVQDRVALVRAQNLASPPVETATLKEALTLVRQVRDQLTVMDRDDKGRLYQFDRLRELCLRLNKQP
jgi:hypothetical protein